MIPQGSDTIAAIATAPGRGAIGIVRLSGPSAVPIASQLCLSATLETVEPERATLMTLADPSNKEIVDDALVLVFRSPKSYTGEDLVEFQCHGGAVTLARVLEVLLAAGARAALPGEFTQRAFLNGKLDLARAEAVCDQIQANTDAAHRLALSQRHGSASRIAKELRESVTALLVQVEAVIDFSEEIGDLDRAALLESLDDLMSRFDALVRTGKAARFLRDGARIAMAGRPNVGKSSLLNALLRRNRAIVTPVPGTTRDTLEEQAAILGMPVTLVDTAGIRDTADSIEAEGVSRAREAVEQADLVLWVVDVEAGLTHEDHELLNGLPLERVLAIANKVDRATTNCLNQFTLELSRLVSHSPVRVSALTGQGLDGLEAAIIAQLQQGVTPSEGFSNARHLEALQRTRNALSLAQQSVRDGMPADFVSIDLRGALMSLGEITGETATEEIIERIFREFCIGK